VIWRAEGKIGQGLTGQAIAKYKSRSRRNAQRTYDRNRHKSQSSHGKGTSSSHCHEETIKSLSKPNQPIMGDLPQNKCRLPEDARLLTQRLYCSTAQSSIIPSLSIPRRPRVTIMFKGANPHSPGPADHNREGEAKGTTSYRFWVLP
jgi:hypothetical protein